VIPPFQTTLLEVEVEAVAFALPEGWWYVERPEGVIREQRVSRRAQKSIVGRAGEERRAWEEGKGGGRERGRRSWRVESEMSLRSLSRQEGLTRRRKVLFIFRVFSVEQVLEIGLWCFSLSVMLSHLAGWRKIRKDSASEKKKSLHDDEIWHLPFFVSSVFTKISVLHNTLKLEKGHLFQGKPSGRRSLDLFSLFSASRRNAHLAATGTLFLPTNHHPSPHIHHVRIRPPPLSLFRPLLPAQTRPHQSPRRSRSLPRPHRRRRNSWTDG